MMAGNGGGDGDGGSMTMAGRSTKEMDGVMEDDGNDSQQRSVIKNIFRGKIYFLHTPP